MATSTTTATGTKFTFAQRASSFEGLQKDYNKNFQGYKETLGEMGKFAVTVNAEYHTFDASKTLTSKQQEEVEARARELQQSKNQFEVTTKKVELLETRFIELIKKSESPVHTPQKLKDVILDQTKHTRYTQENKTNDKNLQILRDNLPKITALKDQMIKSLTDVQKYVGRYTLLTTRNESYMSNFVRQKLNDWWIYTPLPTFSSSTTSKTKINTNIEANDSNDAEVVQEEEEVKEQEEVKETADKKTEKKTKS